MIFYKLKVSLITSVERNNTTARNNTHLYKHFILANLVLVLTFLSTGHAHEQSSLTLFLIVTITGHVFSLKLILYGTKEDPLANNTHVNRTKTVATFTQAQIDQRKKGQLYGKIPGVVP